MADQWEYATHYVKHTAPFGNIHAVKPSKELAELLERMGRERWELVGVSPHIFAGTHQGDILYFKRVKS